MNLRIQELSKIIESFFVESNLVNKKNKPILTGFQGYMSGFDSKGKGTSQGDGKDKAMRQISDGFIGEIKPQRLNNSSSATSFKSYNIQRSDEVNTDKYKQTMACIL
jgi:hypothetical protein